MRVSQGGAGQQSGSWGNRLIVTAMAFLLAATPVAFWQPLYDDFTLPKQCVVLTGAAVLLTGLAWSGRWRIPNRIIALSLAAWAVLAVVSTTTGIDPRGSLLGYYQYRQGMVTQLAYVAVFAGGFALAAAGRVGVVGTAGAGLAGVLAYTLVQAFGLDPFTWWIDTSDRAIGTIGNANELAAFGVITMGLAAFVRPGRMRLAAGMTWGAALFIAMEAESRSGLAAVLLFFVLLAPSQWAAGRSLRELRAFAAPAALGLTAAAALSLASGGLVGAAGRVSGETTSQETSGSTRLALWRGAVAVIATAPLTGTGPDGLYLAFPQERPADLPGAYESYDLVAQSSHNILLDSAANMGLPGLLALLAMTGATAAVSVRAVRGRKEGDGPCWPVAWAAMGAYGALALLNPTSLAAHTVFLAMLGAAAGDALRDRAPEPRPSRVLGAICGTGAAAAIVFAGLLLAADLKAQDGWDRYARGEFERSARAYRNAGRLAPSERSYAARETNALVAAVSVDVGNAAEAEERLVAFDDRFGFASGNAFDLAAVLIARGRPESEIVAVVDRAASLNPHGRSVAGYAARLRVAARQGGVLRFDARDRWTYVEVSGATPGPGAE